MQENRLIWLNGEILPLADAKIHVLSPGFQFGANVFEGIRGYWNEREEQLYIFKLEEHYKRLKNSIKLFRMEDRYSVEELTEALLSIVKANHYSRDIAIRQTVFLDGVGGTWSSFGPVGMFVAPIAKDRTENVIGPGLSCSVSSWERINDRSMSPRSKVGANYINSRMAQIEAKNNGYDTTILLNSEGKVAEGPGSCLFIVRDGELITPPKYASILESITRETILEIARKELGLKVTERNIDRTELYICDEAFLCGSAMEITPITSIDRILINEGVSGKITYDLKALYFDIVSGDRPEYKKYLTPVY
ncbi:MAG: branched-chain amino acid transaminase [Peptostreptococcaceae bacterium]|nr:branched-chain amino acid transaminase [Peptostreptococcaceae bacterium]